MCEGVNIEGGCSHKHKSKYTVEDETLLSVAGIGASMLNKQPIEKMGDYRERLLWSRSPMVGYGRNDSTGAAATTKPDGSPFYSVDDEALPVSFFDPKTGEFSDSLQARLAAKLNVHFGNPFRELRGNSIIPEQYQQQRPPRHASAIGDDGPRTPPGSPPHDAFMPATENEDEAFVLLPRSKKRKPLGKERETPAKKIPSPPESKGDSSLQDAKKEKSKPPPPPKKEKTAKNKPPPPPPPPRPPQTQQKEPLQTPQKEQQQHPQSVQEKLDGQETPPNTNPTPSALDLQSPNVKPKVDLPPGWMTVWSKSQTRWYFFDTKTNKSVWSWPPPPSKP